MEMKSKISSRIVILTASSNAGATQMVIQGQFCCQSLFALSMVAVSKDTKKMQATDLFSWISTSMRARKALYSELYV